MAPANWLPIKKWTSHSWKILGEGRFLFCEHDFFPGQICTELRQMYGKPAGVWMHSRRLVDSLQILETPKGMLIAQASRCIRHIIGSPRHQESQRWIVLYPNRKTSYARLGRILIAFGREHVDTLSKQGCKLSRPCRFG